MKALLSTQGVARRCGLVDYGRDRKGRAGLDNDTEVLIVGGGPIGLGLALDLGWRGVRCLLVEETDGSFPFPRANAVNVRTMELCRRWGIDEAVREAAIPADYPHTVLYVTSLAGHEIARIERPGHGGGRGSAVSPVRPQRCNQMRFDPILRRRAEGFPHVRLRYRCRFESFVQDAEGVTATLADLAASRTEQVRAGFLVACCGGRSGVRGALGIRLEGRAEEGTPVHIFFRAKALWDRHGKGKAALVYLMGPAGRWATMVNVDGRALWSLMVERDHPDRTVSEAEARALVDRALGMAADYEIVSLSYWVRREMVANRYGAGRVAIAGDCAHVNGPEGGLGMNTGMGDAADLGWKLAALAEGWGGPHLLASYEAERRPVALRNVAQATKNLHNHVFQAPDLLAETPEGARQRRAMGERLVADGQRRHGHDGIALGYRYADSPICWPDDEAPPADDPARYVPSAHPGCRAPHVELGNGRSILDLFGPGFVLLDFGGEAAGLVEAAARRRVPLAHHAIGSAEAAALYARKLVLVRPDGHVAWRGDAPPTHPLAVIDRVRGALA